MEQQEGDAQVHGAPETNGTLRAGVDNPAFHTQECGPPGVIRGQVKTNKESGRIFLERKMEAFHQRLDKHKKNLGPAYIAMVISACVLNFQRALALLVITLAGAFFLAWDELMRRVLCVVLLGAVVCWLVLDTAKQGTRPLVSFAGLITYVLLMAIFSKSPFRVSWRVMLWGMGLQFLFGLLILRTKAGFTAVEWVGRQVEIFLAYTDSGSKFVFGDNFQDHFFAFKVLPIIVFFSTIISMLYYIGFMQWLILKTESPLLIRPYIDKLTVSEIHAVMSGGFATIAGSVLGAFISFGIQASHLLTASVMSAPASLAIAKTFWPETETPKVSKKGFKLEKGEGRNLLEAACHGASASIVLVANIAVNLIAFLALLSFLNAALSWLGGMFDYPQLSFSLICSYVFMPFSFLMGVAWEDSFIVGELIGLKTFFNEFVAYERLAELIEKRKEGGPEYVEDVKQYLSV
ncbi:hypothetical protein JZ751_012785, partial [Albula glossodonta]